MQKSIMNEILKSEITPGKKKRLNKDFSVKRKRIHYHVTCSKGILKEVLQTKEKVVPEKKSLKMNQEDWELKYQSNY